MSINMTRSAPSEKPNDSSLVDSLHSAISSHFVGRYRRNRSHSGSRTCHQRRPRLRNRS
ncbi:hypothetical protein T4B_11137 [Trichinella pseudospiralis]|uniref:Uncharacterized protein n=1 Tax=Trichinella pseudospiralis TaxID=6337 RepID=A0A0V1GI04_TRIPS|nr:hypothetical protein T4B_11137 [Trichinella pseudospiralis]KRZ01259.1 hypothetical protein T4C_13707 [Trichinella pseudospiralis]